jgi:hypothetical protein
MTATDNGGVDREVEIERLASLDPVSVDYEVKRAEVAKLLKISAPRLDRIVAKKRRELRLDCGNTTDENGQGHPIKTNDVLPWHEPVSGDRIATTLAAVIKTHGRAVGCCLSMLSPCGLCIHG